MPLTRQDLFKNAVLRGIAASPFSSTTAAPLIVLVGATRTSLAGCQVKVTDNKAKAEEWGIDHVFMITAHIPKVFLATQPRVDLDAVEYQGRQYKLASSAGDEAHSPVWTITGSCPVS